MITKKKLGVWMDHSNAYLIDYANETESTNIIETALSNQYLHKSEEHKSEEHVQNIEQHANSEYYKQISEHIKNFNDVIIFGTTEAKNELYNILKADHYFSKSKIEVAQTDNMTENQRHAFVIEYFSKN